MAIKILNTNAPKAGSSEEDDPIVGEFKNGRQVNGKPESLNYWIIRTDDPDIADALAVHYGVEVEETDYDRKPYQVSLAEDVTIELRVDFLRTAMILKSQATWKAIRTCNGEEMTDGNPCACAVAYGSNTDEFWAASADGIACKPDGVLFAHIVGLEDLGKFVLSKNSRSTVSQFDRLEETAVSLGLDTPYVTDLGIKLIESKKTGRSWTVPTFNDPREEA